MAATHQLERVLGHLASAGLDYWVDSGTLLGLYRDGRLLPNDNDIDLAIWSRDLPRLDALKRAMAADGYRLRVYAYRDLDYKFKFFPASGAGGFEVDLNVFRKSGEHAWCPQDRHEPLTPGLGPVRTLAERAVRFVRYEFVAPRERRHDYGSHAWARFVHMGSWWVPAKLLDPSGDLDRGDLRVRVPARVEDYLALRYGDDWATPRSDWDLWRDDGGLREEPPNELVPEWPA